MIAPIAISSPDPEADARRAALAKAAAGELLGPRDMKAIFHVKDSHWARQVRAGAFDAFRVKPAIGLHCYSGVLVHRYLAGEPLYIPSFGAKRRRPSSGTP